MASRQYKFGPFRLDGDNKRLYNGDKLIELEPKKFEVLLYLVEHPGRLISRSELTDAVWPGEAKGDGLLKVCLNGIRAKLNDDAKNPVYIETHPGEGNWFIAHVVRIESDGPEEDWVPRPPGAPYEHGWYVERGVEASCQTKLKNSFSPLAIRGPKQSGKRTLLTHLLAEEHRRDLRVQIVRLDFSKFPAACFANVEALLHEIAKAILSELRVENMALVMEQAFSRPGTKIASMGWLMERILYRVRLLIVTFERLETLQRSTFQSDFLGMLRSWVQLKKDPMTRLRIICTLATDQGRLDSTKTSGFFNVAIPIQLEDFQFEDVRKLAEIHRLALSEDELRFVWELLHGQPFLTRLLFYQVATSGQPPSALVQSKQGDFGPLTAFLHGKRKELASQSLLDKVRDLAGNPTAAAALSEDDSCDLYEEGILVEEAGKKRLRCKLYEIFFKKD